MLSVTSALDMGREIGFAWRFLHVFGTFLRLFWCFLEFVFLTLLLILKDLSAFVPSIFNIFFGVATFQ